MNPVYFGTSKEPLFGIYHSPKARSGVGSGAVLCAPWGQEYMRTHRALRLLATQLARAGLPAMRFDYYGVGDSAGQSVDGTPGRWVGDIGAAADELRDTASVKELTFIGLRLGALLAAAAAARRKDVRRLVLWDPILEGKDYLGELLSHSDPGTEPGVAGFHGFPLGEKTRQELEGLRLADYLGPAAPETLVVVSHPSAEAEGLVNGAAAAGARVSLRHIPSAGDWDDMDRFGAALLPQQIIRGIVTWLAGEGDAV
jgi:uncharacterized protein